MTYIINYKNLSLMPSYAPQFNITLHSGLALMSGTATVASANRPYTVALPTLMPGQTGQYSFTINKA